MADFAPQKSTIVRSKTMLERRAARQFLTPRRVKAERTLPVDGAFTVRSGRFHLQAWSWGTGPVVLLVHGWEGHAGHLSGFVEPLVNQGFRVVAVDLPAHGHSSGRRASVLAFADALCSVADAVGPVHGVVAHSLGGAATAVALHRGSREGQRFTANRVVLLAPPEGPALFVHGMAAQLGFSPERTAGIARRIQELVGASFEDLTVPKFAHQIDLPLLLMHDPADRVVPWAHAQAIAAAWPGARLRPAPGLGHRRILTDPPVIAEAVSFLSHGHCL